MNQEPTCREKIARLIQMSGLRFGHLEVIQHAEGEWWTCRCDCGAVTNKRGHHLRQGRMLSCGCGRVSPRSAQPPYLAPVGSAWIPLTQGAFALIDAADVALTNTKRWQLGVGGYAVSGAGAKRVRLHKILLPDVTEVDHINRDRLDNRRTNLRAATRAQNSYNSSKPKQHRKRATSSRYKGVSRAWRGHAWLALIQADGVAKRLGQFAFERDAALAYDKAAQNLFGDRACTNKMLGLL